jgi:hypothetical protein
MHRFGTINKNHKYQIDIITYGFGMLFATHDAETQGEQFEVYLQEKEVNTKEKIRIDSA